MFKIPPLCKRICLVKEVKPKSPKVPRLELFNELPNHVSYPQSITYHAYYKYLKIH